MYDNEFRKLQAIYKFSWSFDSMHLHTVLLQPIYEPNPPTATTKPSASNTYQRNAFASFTPDGRVICRNFNGLRGCTLPNCNFAHVCNRRIAGKACAMSHPGFSHKVVEPPSAQTPQWLPLHKLSNSPLNRHFWLLELFLLFLNQISLKFASSMIALVRTDRL